MINLHLPKIHVRTMPFDHYIIDDFFSDETFSVLRDFFDKTNEKISFIDKRKYDMFSFNIDHIEELPEIYHEENKENVKILRKQIPSTVSLVANKLDLSLEKVGTWQANFARTSKGYESKIHLDTTWKVYSFVVYVGDKGDGTELYTGPNEEDFYTRVEWKPNRAILFQRSTETWHRVKNYLDDDRFALVLSLVSTPETKLYLPSHPTRKIIDDSL